RHRGPASDRRARAAGRGDPHLRAGLALVRWAPRLPVLCKPASLPPAGARRLGRADRRGRGRTGVRAMTLRYADAAQSRPAASDKALVSMIGGERYQRCWHGVVQPTWTAYADRHGLDIVLIRFPIDRSARAAQRSIAWQKCLVPEQDWAR